MAAAAAEEAADVNAPPFIGRRRLAASRDGARAAGLGGGGPAVQGTARARSPRLGFNPRRAAGGAGSGPGPPPWDPRPGVEAQAPRNAVASEAIRQGPGRSARTGL